MDLIAAAADIPAGATVLVDTNPIIYLLEGSALASKFEHVFSDIDAGRIRAVITPITLAEVLAGPLGVGNEAGAERYRVALTANEGWTLRDIDAEIAVLAARVRAQYRLKLPDAIQVAVAVHEGCFALVTHDHDFGVVQDLAVFCPT